MYWEFVISLDSMVAIPAVSNSGILQAPPAAPSRATARMGVLPATADPEGVQVAGNPKGFNANGEAPHAAEFPRGYAVA